MQGRGHCSLKLKNVGDNEKLANKKQQQAEAGNAASGKLETGSWKLEAASSKQLTKL